MYAGCVSGAIQKDAYLNIISEVGFENVSVQKEKAVILPDEILKNYLSDAEILSYKNEKFGVFSITVFGQKPSCAPGCCC